MRRPVVPLLIALTGLVIAAPSASAVTVGAPLNQPANTVEGCEKVVFPALRPTVGIPPSCTFFGLDARGTWTSQTPPGRWIINQARVRTGPRVGPMVFTALRALRSRSGAQGIACCTSVAESQVFVPQPNSINTIPVSMPVVNTTELIDNEQVEVVDYLGITLLTTESSVPTHIATSPADPAVSGTGSYFAPALRLGQTGAGPGAVSGETLLVNAEYQPAGSGPLPPTPVALTGPPALVNPFTLRPGASLLNGGTRARLRGTVPGPGVLRASSAARARVARADTAAVARTAAKRRPPLRKLVLTGSLRVRKAGSVQITVRLSKWGRKLLTKRRQLRVPVRLSFTPTGGKATTVSRRVTFKRPTTKAKTKAKAKARARR